MKNKNKFFAGLILLVSFIISGELLSPFGVYSYILIISQLVIAGGTIIFWTLWDKKNN